MTDNADLPGTYGRYFVFPVPHCNTSVKPYLLIRAETEKLMVEVTLSGLFSEVVHTRMEGFSKFALPCRLLKKTGMTPSGAIKLSTSRRVMCYVTYAGDSFLVYPVQALGSRYTVSLNQFHFQPSPDYPVLHVAVTAALKNTLVSVEVKHPSQKLRNEKTIVPSNITKISLNENDVSILDFPHTLCTLHIVGSGSLFVLVWSTIENDLGFIEQLAPDYTWGAEYVFPVPAWISTPIQVSITAGDIGESNVIIRTEQKMNFFVIESSGNLATEVPADGFVHVSSSQNVQVLFLVGSPGSENGTVFLIAGVALSQYGPMTCQIQQSAQDFTIIAYLQYNQWPSNKIINVLGNISTILNFTILEVGRSRRISVPYLHEVVGALTMYVYRHDLTAQLQVLTGANMHLKYPSFNSTLINVTTASNETAFLNDTSSDRLTDIFPPNEISDIFVHIGCPQLETSGISNWFRGRLKSTGVTASVIAVIISIVIAILGVIGFIIGLMIIDLTGDQHHVRQTRVVPMEEDPSLQE